VRHARHRQFRELDDPDRFVWLRGFADDPRRRPEPEGRVGAGGVVIATVDNLSGPPAPDAGAAPGHTHEAAVLARLVTEPARNAFVRLPVREDANVLVTFLSYATGRAYHPSPIIGPGAHHRDHLRHAPSPLPAGERAG
jgi:hypothetical protein